MVKPVKQGSTKAQYPVAELQVIFSCHLILYLLSQTGLNHSRRIYCPIISNIHFFFCVETETTEEYKEQHQQVQHPRGYTCSEHK
jgi:hypothetical protein